MKRLIIKLVGDFWIIYFSSLVLMTSGDYVFYGHIMALVNICLTHEISINKGLKQ